MNVVEERALQGLNQKECKEGEFKRRLPNVSDGGKNLSPSLFPLSMRQEMNAVDVDRLVRSTLVSSGKRRSPSSAVDYDNHVRPCFHTYIGMKNIIIVTMVSWKNKCYAVFNDQKEDVNFLFNVNC